MKVDQLRSLRERVLAASGPDYALMREAADLLLGWDTPEADIYFRAGMTRLLNVGAWTDFALALVERMLPGWCWGIHHLDGEHRAYLGTPKSADEYRESFCCSAEGSSPALALISTLLVALIAQEEAKEPVR